MAQVAYYYKFPARYNYTAMPLMPSSGVNYPDMATLMSDIGGFVNMAYGPTTSGALGTAITPAFINNLGYNASATLENYTSTAITDIETNINHSQVTLLTGFDNSGQGGHCWVCDGYSTYEYFDGQCNPGAEGLYDYHMNWGFGEIGASSNYIGWYSGVVWAVDGYDFGTNLQAVVNIHP